MLYFILGGLFLIIDQISKFLTESILNPYESVTIVEGVLDFTRHHNTGGPWSMLSDYSYLFIIVTFILLIGEIFFFKKFPLTSPMSKLTCSLINAGAIGNLIDRIFRGYVVDMIRVTFIDYPVFNIADCCIVVGCILMCIYVLFIYKEPAKKSEFINEESDNEQNNT